MARESEGGRVIQVLAAISLLSTSFRVSPVQQTYTLLQVNHIRSSDRQTSISIMRGLSFSRESRLCSIIDPKGNKAITTIVTNLAHLPSLTTMFELALFVSLFPSLILRATAGPSNVARMAPPFPGSIPGHSRVYLVDCSSGPAVTDSHSSEIAFYTTRPTFNTTGAGEPNFSVPTNLTANTLWQNNGTVSNPRTQDVFEWSISRLGLPPGSEVGDSSLADRMYTLVYGPGLLLYSRAGQACQATYTSIQVQGPR